MKSTLLQLYDGEISPAEQYIPKTEEYHSLRQENYRHYEDFIQKLKALTPPLHERFIEIMDEQFDELPFDTSAMFVDGFRLGAKMMIDVFKKDFISEEE